MRKKYLPKNWQVLMKIVKGIIRVTLWALFFLLRVILFYCLCRWAFQPNWLAFLSGFVLACGSDIPLFRRETNAWKNLSLYVELSFETSWTSVVITVASLKSTINKSDQKQKRGLCVGKSIPFLLELARFTVTKTGRRVIWIQASLDFCLLGVRVLFDNSNDLFPNYSY